VIIIFIIFGLILALNVTMPTALYDGIYGDDGFDYWWITHLLLYTVLGFLYPRQPIRFFTIGAAWELFEYGAGCIPIFHEKGNPDEKPKKILYSKWNDLWGNMVGYCFGWGLAELTKNTQWSQNNIIRHKASVFAF
jgi:hypothetical protein